MARILVVDDDERVRTTARALLEADGFQVIEAGSGNAALQMLGAEAVDAVLTDIFMPDTDGIELIHAVRRQFPDLPVVAMSGGGFGGGREVLAVARLLGAAAVVQKPLSQKKLVGAVRRALTVPSAEG
jgi:CheY-like chemotaxis protein